MTRITTYVSIITMNVGDLNSPIKRHKLAGLIKKQDTAGCWWLMPVI
jgi:hypothetical protein